MTVKSLSRRRAAILVANGFMEGEVTTAQRALMNVGASVRTVSSESGLVNSWSGTGWGLNFAVDTPLNKALAAEYDILVVPSGARSMEKLKLTAHTRRFIGGFLAAGKPVCIMGEGVALLGYFNLAQDMQVSASEKYAAELTGTGAIVSGDMMTRYQNLLSAQPQTPEDIQEVIAFFVNDVAAEIIDSQSLAA
ncbi:MAG: DJ-1/PfpI family protein [Pseudomonadota bacterium]